MKTHKQTENIQETVNVSTATEDNDTSIRNLRKDRTDMFQEYPDVVGVGELCKMLGGIGKNLGYQLLRDRKIPHIRIGRTIKIAKPDIINYVIDAEITDEYFKD